MKIGPKETQAWIDKIKEKGFKSFRLRQLPEELRDKKLLLRAKSLGLICKEYKDDNCVNTWKIIDNSKDRKFKEKSRWKVKR